MLLKQEGFGRLWEAPDMWRETEEFSRTIVEVPPHVGFSALLTRCVGETPHARRAR